MLKNYIREGIQKSLKNIRNRFRLPEEDIPFEIEIPRIPQHGDYATNAPILLSHITGIEPVVLANAIKSEFDDVEGIIKDIVVAEKGFLNFFIKDQYFRSIIPSIIKNPEGFGRSSVYSGKRVQIEFVSANPTGPLHVGHGRCAVVGDTIARLIEAVGGSVVREYYINDVGSQMETLGKSLFLRYLESTGREVSIPEDYYRGEYIKNIADEFYRIYGDIYSTGGENDNLQIFIDFAKNRILENIKKDLEDFNIKFDIWFSESDLYSSGEVDRVIETMRKKGLIEIREGAHWFLSTRFGDEKDRVAIRRDGRKTYFASDMAYHMNKFNRGFNLIINIWGADHHGYVPRIMALCRALGKGDDVLRIVLVQFVRLLRGGRAVGMSTRAGKFITLREVMDEVGRDATRFFFLMRRSDSHLDFDIELAKKQSEDNPVYYVQYAHARIASILREAKERGISTIALENANLELLKEDEEINLLKKVCSYRELIEGAAISLEPHRITTYLIELSGLFHSFYNRYRVINEDPDITMARLILVTSIKVVLKNALELIGVSAPEKM